MPATPPRPLEPEDTRTPLQIGADIFGNIQCDRDALISAFMSRGKDKDSRKDRQLLTLIDMTTDGMGAMHAYLITLANQS